MKLWATTVTDEKISKDIVFEYEHADNEDEFVAVLHDVCELLDIPTPIATRVNFTHFVMFNTTRFKPRDFVESVNFDYFNVEAIPEKKK